jgi:hypothetical protein
MIKQEHIVKGLIVLVLVLFCIFFIKDHAEQKKVSKKYTLEQKLRIEKLVEL